MNATIRSDSGRGRALAGLDRSGAAVSALCAAHCAAMPLALAFFPALGILGGERTELALLAASVGVGLLSFGLGYRVHRSGRVGLVLAAGLALLGAGRFAEGREAEALGAGLMVGGGLAIAAAHLLSRRLCSACAARGPAPAPAPALAPGRLG